MRLDTVHAYSQHLSAKFTDFLVLIPEPAGFDRAAWSIILGVEVEDEFLAPKILEMNGLACCVLRGKVGGCGSRLGTGYSLHFATVGFAWRIYAHRYRRCPTVTPFSSSSSSLVGSLSYSLLMSVVARRVRDRRRWQVWILQVLR